MTNQSIIQSISINLLRMSQWYHIDPVGNRALCEVYLSQSKQLADQADNLPVIPFLDQVANLAIEEDFSHNEHLAEQFLTLGVLLQSR